VPTIAALVVSLLALALAAAACFKPTHDDAAPAMPQYSDQQVADAKKNVCDAYQTMYKALQGAASLSSNDPNEKFMLAINARLAFNTAADYLIMTSSENPAAPSELLNSARNLAISYQKLVLARTSQPTGDEIDTVNSGIREAEASLIQACK